jgi:hypothetical protein
MSGSDPSELPLAAAAERLRGLPGRPRKAGTRAQQTPALAGSRVNTGDEGVRVPTLCPLTPRLLDQEGAARYLAVSTWTVRDLEAAGHLPRVRLPLPGGRDLRKLLYDRADLDRLIEASKG